MTFRKHHYELNKNHTQKESQRAIIKCMEKTTAEAMAGSIAELIILLFMFSVFLYDPFFISISWINGWYFIVLSYMCTFDFIICQPDHKKKHLQYKYKLPKYDCDINHYNSILYAFLDS